MDWNVVSELIHLKDYRAIQRPMMVRIVNPFGQWAARRAFLELLGLLKTGDVRSAACRGDDRLARSHRESVALE
jgi:hypothetical protein